MKSRFFKHLATLGPIGYFIAPGTIASLVTIFISLFLSKLVSNAYLQLLIICLFSTFAYIVIKKCRTQFGCKDPSQIVLDEVAGCLFAFYNLPSDINIYFWAFTIFRFLDITKIFGIAHLEKKCPGAFGILIDDIAAGILTNIIIHLIIR